MNIALVLIISALAGARVFRLWRLDKIAEPLRERVDEGLFNLTVKHAERRNRRAVAEWFRYLLGCPWCLNVYFAAFFVGTGLAWGYQFWWQLLAGGLAVSYVAAQLNVHLDKDEDDE